MESYFIQDSQITASSEWDVGHEARNARLNLQASSGIRTGGWVAGQNILNQWLQVDFIKTVTLVKVATQGRMDADQWVTSFSLSYSMDGNVFKVYQQSGSDKVSVTQWQKKNLLTNERKRMIKLLHKKKTEKGDCWCHYYIKTNMNLQD